MKTGNTLQLLRETLLSSLAEYKSIGLVTHKNPDGDGLCCCLALQEMICVLFPDKKDSVKIILEEPAPRSLHFLEADNRCIVYDDAMQFALIVVFDCHSFERVGLCAPLLTKSQRIIAIDHHESNPAEQSVAESDISGFLYNNPRYVSAGAILYAALTAEISSLPDATKEYAATNIYVSILNDTNRFTNSNTDDKVFGMCAELVGLGVNAYEVNKSFLSAFSPAYYRFLGQTLATITTHSNESVLFFHSTVKMLSDNGLSKDATNKMTDNIKGLPESVKVTVYFRELEGNRYRLSLRSNHINVNKIATIYGGGGHISASGCEIKGDLPQIKEKILELIAKELTETK